MDLVKIEQLSFYRNERAIFQDVDLAVPEGSVTAILGPSGSGKTTLLKLIAGSLKPTKGKVYFDDTLISEAPQAALYRLRKEIGFLFQSSALFTSYTVYDNVAFPLRELTDLPENIIRSIVLMNLEAVGLRGARDLYPSELSGGMSRRVALARAIVLDPRLMMYDEPFTGQDPISMGVLMKLIKSLNEQLGMTSILVSHDVDEALQIADKIFVVADGKVLATGSPEEMRGLDTPQVKQFLCGLPDGPVPFHFAAPPIVEDLFE